MSKPKSFIDQIYDESVKYRSGYTTSHFNINTPELNSDEPKKPNLKNGPGSKSKPLRRTGIKAFNKDSLLNEKSITMNIKNDTIIDMYQKVFNDEVERLKNCYQAVYNKNKHRFEGEYNDVDLSGQILKKKGINRCPITDIPITGGTISIVNGFKNGMPLLISVISYLNDYLPLFYDRPNGNNYYILPSVLKDFNDTILEEPITGKFSFVNDHKYLKYEGFYRYGNPFEMNSKTPKNIAYEMGAFSPTFKSTCGLRYTFGVELECLTSNIRAPLTRLFNMSCVRDGSLKDEKLKQEHGPEYVTGVLNGDSGLIHLNKICNFLIPRSVIDKKCGVHVHIGSMNVSKQFALTMYSLGQKVEESLFSTLPPSRRTNEYCRRLVEHIVHLPKVNSPNFQHNIDLEYDKLIEHIGSKKLIGNSRVFDGHTINKKLKHPLGEKCGYNHASARYEWLNLVPLVFNDKGREVYTVEFRPHGGSLNFNKIKYWILNCMCLVNFAENHYERIATATSLKLNEIINTVLDDKGKHLIKYNEMRTQAFKSSKSETAEYDSNLNPIKSIKELCV